MAGIYLIVAFLNFPLALDAFMKFLQTFINLLPIMLLVFIAIFVTNLFLKPELIERHLGNESGLKGWAYAILASFIVIGPPYIIFPLLGELKKHGMKYSLMAVFLNNKNVQLVFLPAMIYYFGLPFTLVLSIYGISFSILSGLLIGKLTNDKA